MGGKIIGVVLALAVVVWVFGGFTLEAATKRYDKPPLHLQIRIVVLFPLYWTFRLCALVFYTPEPISEKFTVDPPQLLSWLRDDEGKIVGSS